MVRLIGTGGVVIDAMPEAVKGLLDVGFRPVGGEAPHRPSDVGDPEAHDTMGAGEEAPEAPETSADAGVEPPGAQEPASDADDGLQLMTNRKLAELAELMGVDVPRKANKAQLVELVREARRQDGSEPTTEW